LGLTYDAQTPLTVKEMLSAEEMFLTNSTMGIRPVVSAEKHKIGNGKPGPITKKIMAAYQELLDRECSNRKLAEGFQQDEST
jgi:branched-subunit amino acid aminotransferase/4-amino-4-deoxychorismate lyase